MAEEEPAVISTDDAEKVAAPSAETPAAPAETPAAPAETPAAPTEAAAAPAEGAEAPAEAAAAPAEKAALPADQSASDGAPVEPSDEHEILSDQFDNYYRIAESYLSTLQRPKDIEIGTNLLRRVQRLNDSKSIQVKRNNNCFFRYCLKILKWTSENQPLELYKLWYRNTESVGPATESRTWLEDNKSYMAIKYLKDGTYVIYGAVAEDPSAGWQDGGLSILAKAGACESANKQ